MEVRWVKIRGQIKENPMAHVINGGDWVLGGDGWLSSFIQKGNQWQKVGTLLNKVKGLRVLKFFILRKSIASTSPAVQY